MSTPVTNGAQGRSRRAPHRPASFAPPRVLPWSSWLTKVWPGTCMMCWTVLTTLLLLKPTWVSVAAGMAVLLVGSIVVRVPFSALPKPPAWFWSGLIGGMVGASFGGGLLVFIRALALALTILWGTALLLWTYSTEELAQAAYSWVRPLRRIGIPADEWARMMYLSLRALPVVRDQAIAVMDTAKLRMGRSPQQLGFAALGRLVVDVSTATLSASHRGAINTGRAMSIRGGFAPLEKKPVRLSWRDAVVVIVSATVVVGVCVWG